MGDVVFVVVTVAFFALTVLLVKACDRIIGPAPDGASESTVTPPTAADTMAAETMATTTSAGR
jgi:hypothetical protein